MSRSQKPNNSNQIDIIYPGLVFVSACQRRCSQRSCVDCAKSPMTKVFPEDFHAGVLHSGLIFFITASKRSFAKVVFTGVCLSTRRGSRSLSGWVSVRGVSLQGVSVQEGLCPGGLCPGVSVRGVSVQEVSVRGGLCLRGGGGLVTSSGLNRMRTSTPSPQVVLELGFAQRTKVSILTFCLDTGRDQYPPHYFSKSPNKSGSALKICVVFSSNQSIVRATFKLQFFESE